VYCDPERLQALQRIFNTIWMAARLRASKQNSRCSDALRAYLVWVSFAASLNFSIWRLNLEKIAG
jgi:tryptophan-rich sensory protein